MDFRQLATGVTVFLTPFFPYLILGTGGVAKKVEEKFGEATFGKAKSIWNEIHGIVKSDRKMLSASDGMADNPDDEDYQVIFSKALAKQLESTPTLARDLISLMKDDKAVQKVLIEQESKVKNIHQYLEETGEQEIVVRESQTGIIIQEQYGTDD